MIEDYFNDIKNIPLLTEEQERELVAAGNKDELVIHNLRLAYSIAISFQNRGVSLEDLIQEANIGLMIAADRFDAEKGYRFSTYASHWVRQKLSRTIANNGRTIRIPSHIIDTNSKIEKIIGELRASLMREPNIEEVAREVDKTAEEVREIRSYFTDPLSIDATIGEDEDNTICSVIEDKNIETPIEDCIMNLNEEIVNMVLATLPDREARIIRLRIIEGRSLGETGKIMELSDERVRQLELKAMRKLRHPYRSNILRDLII